MCMFCLILSVNNNYSPKSITGLVFVTEKQCLFCGLNVNTL
jgi:hypothetical protein